MAEEVFVCAKLHNFVIDTEFVADEVVVMSTKIPQTYGAGVTGRGGSHKVGVVRGIMNKIRELNMKRRIGDIAKLSANAGDMIIEHIKLKPLAPYAKTVIRKRSLYIYILLY